MKTAQPDKEVRKALGFANGNVNVVCDGGNARFKLATDKDDTLHVEHFTHALAEISMADYEELCYRHKNTDAWYFIKWNGRYFVTGDEAFNYNPTFDPLRGRQKYEKDYYGILFIAGMLRLFKGQVPEVVNALLAHPPADLQHRNSLMRSVIGTWHIECNGAKQSVKVEFVNTYDEIVGGVMNATIAPDGQLYKDLDFSGKTLVFDLGGGTLDLAYVEDGVVDYDHLMDSTRIGGNTAVNTFKRIFDHQYRELVSEYEDGLPRELIHEIFLDPEHSLILAGGEKLDCSSLYQQAIAPVIRTARDAVKQFGGNLIGVRRVLLTGGVSGLMYLEICKQVFPKFYERGAIRTAESRAKMLEANGRGGLKMLPGMKAASTKLARQLAKKR